MRWEEFSESTNEWLDMLKSVYNIQEGENIRNCHIWISDSNLKVFYSEDNTPKWRWLKHLSVSRKNRYPTWDEIVLVKEKFMGDINVAMILPRKEDYINIHENCFHLWQIPEGWGLQ